MIWASGTVNVESRFADRRRGLADLFIRAMNRGKQSAWLAAGLIDEKGGHTVAIFTA